MMPKMWAKGLTGLGYQVTARYDDDLAGLKQTVAAFAETVKGDEAALAVVYFAGRGLQQQGRDFLLPVNFDTRQPQADLDKRALAVDRDLIQGLSGRAGGNVIILDACREDPFGERDGLAQIDDVPKGTLVELAAEPNSPALDSLDPKAPDRNGVYAKQFVKKLENPSPDMDIRHFFDMVGNNVYEVTNRVQKPRVMTAQTPPAMPAKLSLAPSGAPNPMADEELKSWRQVAKTSAVCAFEYHLKRFPNGVFADSCRATINAIRSKLDSASRAFADLPPDLKAQVTDTFRQQQAASTEECARKWSADGKGQAGLLAPRPAVAAQAAGFALRSSTARSGAIMPAACQVADAPRWQVSASSHHAGAPVPAIHQRPLPALANPALRLAWGGDAEPANAVGEAVPGDEDFQADLLSAEQGEINAMYRVALIYEAGSHGVEENQAETMRWLALSSASGNGLASYKLYRYFAAQSTGYAKAVKFKSLANRQGYYGPVTLSEKR